MPNAERVFTVVSLVGGNGSKNGALEGNGISKRLGAEKEVDKGDPRIK